MENKMTKRDFYNDIKAMAEAADREDIVAFCDNEIELLDKKAAKAKERQAEKKAAGDELTDAVKAAMTNEFETREVIAARVAETFGEDASLAKVGYRISALVRDGIAEATDIKVPATETSKASTKKAYKLV